MKLWCNGTLVLDTQLTTTRPVTSYVRTASLKWLLLESWVSRVVPLRQLGIDADGEVGVRIEWTPVSVARPDASALSCGR